MFFNVNLIGYIIKALQNIKICEIVAYDKLCMYCDVPYLTFNCEINELHWYKRNILSQKKTIIYMNDAANTTYITNSMVNTK